MSFRMPFSSRASTKSMPVQGAMGWLGGMSAPEPLSNNPLELLRLNVGIVAACGARNAQAIASANLRLYAKKRNGRKMIDGVAYREVSKKRFPLMISSKALTSEDDVVEILDHPLLDVLSQVNLQMDYHGLAESTEMYLGACGTAYWLIEGTPPTEIWLLPSEYVEALVDRTGRITSYRVNDMAGVPQYYPVEQVIRFVAPTIGAFRAIGMQPTVGIYGIGSIEQCLPEARLMYEINVYERSLVANQAVPAHVVTYKGGTLEPERRLALKKMWNAIFRGPSRAGKTEILDGDFDVKQLGLSPKDLDYETGKKWLRNVIANSFGVPEDLLSSENANRATAEASYRSYVELTVIPKLKRYVDTLNARLTPLYDDGMFLAADDPTPENTDLELKEEEMELSNGVISVNEARAKRNLPPIEVDLRGSPGKTAKAGGQ